MILKVIDPCSEKIAHMVCLDVRTGLDFDSAEDFALQLRERVLDVWVGYSLRLEAESDISPLFKQKTGARNRKCHSRREKKKSSRQSKRMGRS